MAMAGTKNTETVCRKCIFYIKVELTIVYVYNSVLRWCVRGVRFLQLHRILDGWVRMKKLTY